MKQQYKIAFIAKGYIGEAVPSGNDFFTNYHLAYTQALRIMNDFPEIIAVLVWSEKSQIVIKRKWVIKKKR